MFMSSGEQRADECSEQVIENLGDFKELIEGEPSNDLPPMRDTC